MCFSATASFIAGSTLSAIGVATIRKVEHRSELPFATIPLLFGVQQLVEGVIWLTITHHAPHLQQTLIYVYSIFAYVIWPIYVPFAFRVLEATPWRRNAMLWLQAAGLAVGLNLLYFRVTSPPSLEVIGQHIVYVMPSFHRAHVVVLYFAATCFTGFVSSHTFGRLFGIAAMLSYIVTYFFYTLALVSVWCFFAAILSVIVYLHLRYRHLGGFPRVPQIHALNLD